MALALASPVTAQPPARAGQGWLGEFEHASRQLLQLAEAIPAEKFAWRPAPGVRSISELYMHVAIGNYLLLGLAGRQAAGRPGDAWQGAGEEPHGQGRGDQVREELLRRGPRGVSGGRQTEGREVHRQGHDR